MRKYGGHGKVCLRSLMDAHILSPPEYERAVFGILFLCMCFSTAPELPDEYYSRSAYESLLMIGHFSKMALTIVI
jgi:hypothetical protein